MFARHPEPEEMDDLSLDARMHVQALEGLARINYCSRSAETVWSAIQAFGKKTGRNSFRILDIATGGGDVPVFLWQKARRAGFSLEIDGCDKSPQAIHYAQARAR